MANSNPEPQRSAHTIKMAVAQLDLPLKAAEIPMLRRYVNRFVGSENDLFHNHASPQKFHYRYPLVQYKRIENKAAIMGITEPGAEALDQLLAHPEFREACQLWIGNHFAQTAVSTDQYYLHTEPRQQYRLRQYIALNEHNLAQWHENPALPARAALLERCITGHILKCCSAIRWQLPPKSLLVQLLDYEPYRGRTFDNTFICFDALFCSNIELPEHIGLGKAVSHGHGILERLNR